MARTPSYDKSGLRKGIWTVEEDMKLIAYITRYGCWNWRQLPMFAGNLYIEHEILVMMIVKICVIY